MMLDLIQAKMHHTSIYSHYEESIIHNMPLFMTLKKVCCSQLFCYHWSSVEGSGQGLGLMFCILSSLLMWHIHTDGLICPFGSIPWNTCTKWRPLQKLKNETTTSSMWLMNLCFYIYTIACKKWLWGLVLQHLLSHTTILIITFALINKRWASMIWNLQCWSHFTWTIHNFSLRQVYQEYSLF